MKSLTDAANEIHTTARDKGFWSGEVEDFPFFAYKTAMIHSEVTELMEAMRKDKGHREIEFESADILIRLLDLYEAMYRAGFVQRDLDTVVTEKMKLNNERPRLHGVKG